MKSQGDGQFAHAVPIVGAGKPGLILAGGGRLKLVATAEEDRLKLEFDTHRCHQGEGERTPWRQPLNLPTAAGRNR
jgi:hypothetical protein